MTSLTSLKAQERLFKIIQRPHLSEKTSRLADKHRQFVFKVIANANKLEVKRAIEITFGVNVTAVQILNVKGKTRRFKQVPGRRKDWKKAYVTLKEGQDINFTSSK